MSSDELGLIIDLSDKQAIQRALKGLQVPGLENHFDYAASFYSCVESLDDIYVSGLLMSMALVASRMFSPTRDNLCYRQVIWFLPMIADKIIGDQPGNDVLRADFRRQIQSQFGVTT